MFRARSPSVETVGYNLVALRASATLCPDAVALQCPPHSARGIVSRKKLDNGFVSRKNA